MLRDKPVIERQILQGSTYVKYPKQPNPWKQRAELEVLEVKEKGKQGVANQRV